MYPRLLGYNEEGLREGKPEGKSKLWDIVIELRKENKELREELLTSALFKKCGSQEVDTNL